MGRRKHYNFYDDRFKATVVALGTKKSHSRSAENSL